VLPYARQSVDEDDIAAVEAVLRSDWLTTGPKVPEFEAAMARRVGAAHGVAVSSGTAALHAAMHALDIQPGDEVVVPAMTFASTANAVVFEQGVPRFADVDPETLLLDPTDAEARITERTRAIVAVDYAGHPADYEALRTIATRHGLALVADACHALGSWYQGKAVGSLADLTAFSFHPVKHVTTGEGGMVTTDDAALAERMSRFRNHGITTDHRARDRAGSWFYEMVELGVNYRLTDFQAALGISQLTKLDGWLSRRRAIAGRYDEAFADVAGVTPLTVRSDVEHAYHLYVVQLELAHLRGGRAEVYRALRDEGIGVNVHYIPVHLHPYYRERFGTEPGLCPNAEQAYDRILTLPLFPGMSDTDVDDVVRAVTGVLTRLAA
jgi:perosamine synthetase